MGTIQSAVTFCVFPENIQDNITESDFISRRLLFVKILTPEFISCDS